MRTTSNLFPLIFGRMLQHSLAYQFVSDSICNFTFHEGDLPNFQLPEAGPNNPGDIVLNQGNRIVPLANSSEVLLDCNGESSAYYIGNDTWNTTFFNDGTVYDIDIFYASYGDELWVRTIQPHMDPNLYEKLNNTVIRLNVTCDSYVSCVQFTTNFTDQSPYNYSTAFPFNDSCYHGFSSGERVPAIGVPAASPVGPSWSSALGSNTTLILAGKADVGLPWSEGFEEDGEEKEEDGWDDWWDKRTRRYGRGDSSDDESSSSEDRRRSLGASRRLTLDPETDCRGNISELWDPRTGEWLSSYQTIDGESHAIDMFFMKEVDGSNELWVTEIQSWMAPSLYNQLQYRYVRLNLTCPASTVVDSCVIFEPRFTNWSPDIDGTVAGYRFNDPALPTFDVPEAVPNSPGDVILTASNYIVTKMGALTETSCNGDQAEYYGEDNHWYTEFLKSTGESHELKHVVYPTTKNLYAATIQSVWEPNLTGLLTNRTLRITIWCTNDERAEWLYFRIAGESASCDEIEGLCDDINTSNSSRIGPTIGRFATMLSASYLGWLFS